MLLAVLMVVGMFPMTAFAAEIPSDLKIVEITEATAFEEGEVLGFSKWGMEGYSAPSWIATVPAGTETVKITYKSDDVPTYSGKISGGAKIDIFCSKIFINISLGIISPSHYPYYIVHSFNKLTFSKSTYLYKFYRFLYP